MALIAVPSLKKVSQNPRNLFGPGLEEKVIKHAETAKVISTALLKPNHASKKFSALPKFKAQLRAGGPLRLARQQLFQRQGFQQPYPLEGRSIQQEVRPGLPTFQACNLLTRYVSESTFIVKHTLLGRLPSFPLQ